MSNHLSIVVDMNKLSLLDAVALSRSRSRRVDIDESYCRPIFLDCLLVLHLLQIIASWIDAETVLHQVHEQHAAEHCD